MTYPVHIQATECPVTGVMTTPLIDLQAMWQAALVFALPQRLAQAVQRRRSELQGRVSAPLEYQLAPHMTLLFLGPMTGERLLVLWKALAPFRTAQLDIGIEGIGAFLRQGRMVNLHLRIRTSVQLQSLHQRALKICRQYEWYNGGPYIGEGYTPHITIFDQVDIPDADSSLTDEAWLTGLREHTLCAPALMSKRL